MVPNTLQLYILYESHNALGYNGSTRLYNLIRRHYCWREWHQHSNKYVQSCRVGQQVTLKEPQYINSHLPVPQFPMSFISMVIRGPYHKTEKGNQHTLTVVCMLTNCIFMISVRSKSTEEVIKAYLTDVYSTFGGSKYILSDRGSQFASKQFTRLAKGLGFIKVYTSPYTPTGNSVIEWTYAFLKASLRNLFVITT